MSSSAAKAKYFLYGCFGFIFGIAGASFLPARFLHLDLGVFGAVVFLFVVFIFCKHERAVCFYLWVLMFFLFGLWRYSIALPPNTLDKIWHYNNQTVDFFGVISQEPDVRLSNQKLTIATKCLLDSDFICRRAVSGNVLATVGLYPSYEYGLPVFIQCRLQAPEAFAEFNYDRYLARHDIYSLCYFPKISTADVSINLTVKQKFYQKIFYLKNKLKQSIDYGLLEPESSLLKAIILGDRRGLSPDLLDNFAKAGISHVIAISGMHIAIISIIILNTLLFVGLSRRQSFLFASLILFSYIILIGLSASALRAGFMAFLAMVAVYFGRLNKMANSLCLAAVILLLFNPLLLRDDVGFQLSFLALLGIIYTKPLIDNLVLKFFTLKPKFYLESIIKPVWEVISVTLAAQFLTIPLLIYYFHQVSIVSLIVNLLVLPFLPLIMLLGIFATAISAIFPPVAWLIFAPVYFLLKYVIWLSDASVHWPLAYIEIDYVWPGWVVLFYIGTAVLIIWHNRTKKNAII